MGTSNGFLLAKDMLILLTKCPLQELASHRVHPIIQHNKRFLGGHRAIWCKTVHKWSAKWRDFELLYL